MPPKGAAADGRRGRHAPGLDRPGGLVARGRRRRRRPRLVVAPAAGPAGRARARRRSRRRRRPQPDRCVRPGEAAGEGARAVARGRPADADPPALLRPDRPAARRRRRSTRSSPTRPPTPTRGWSTACSSSPRYGERWARHWLDVVHYGDTHGYDKDKPRPNAWPYRDYVIRAFNDDKPYARFVQEQIAGDVLFPDTRDGIDGARVHRRRAVGLHRPRRGAGDQDRRQDRPPPRPRRHGRQHDRHLRQPDGPVRPVPQPQVRPDPAGGLLPPAGRLRGVDRADRPYYTDPAAAARRTPS